MGVEPTSSAWKAEVIAIIRHPHTRTYQIKNWWRGEDSNLRRQSQQIYSLPPLAAREPLHYRSANLTEQIAKRQPLMEIFLSLF